MNAPALLQDVLAVPRGGVTVGLLVLGCVVWVFSARQRRRRLPPGPAGLPVLGHVFQLGQFPWLTFTAWKEKYGPVIYLNGAGQPIVVLNTLEAAADLLDRKASVTSDRPRLIVPEMMTGGMFMPFVGHNDLWRRMRKAVQDGLREGASQGFGPVQYREGVVLAADMLTEPGDWFSHCQRAVASTIMPIIYGKALGGSKGEANVAGFHGFIHGLTRAAMPGANLVELFTWMRHTPSRFAPWKRRANKFFVQHSAMFGDLLEDTRTAVKQGDKSPSLVRSLIEDGHRYGVSDTESYWLASAAFSGGQTAVGVLAWWMMAMVLFPETQRRAHEELDRVVGRDRLPTLDDCDKLPYLQAMVKESIRWRPIDPIGLPRSSSTDLWYKGYFIPKGSLLIPNVWAINRDPGTFGPDAHLFNPARHLDPVTGRLGAAPADTKDEGHVTFGFGRRICVGRHIANDMLLIQLALMLWSMNVEAERGQDGKYVALDIDGCVDDGLVVRPVLFGVTIAPRSGEALSMLHAAKRDLVGP